MLLNIIDEKGFIVKKLLTICFLLVVTKSYANDNKIDLQQFAQDYFATMVASQAPNATTKELEAYLALLTDDIGHTHLPWQTNGDREPDGKASMRKGMTFYLGAHTEHQAKLLDVFVFNHSAVAIRYENYAKGIHPQSKQTIEYRQIMMEVLEMDGDKVGVIRKYHE